MRKVPEVGSCAYPRDRLGASHLTITYPRVAGWGGGDRFTRQSCLHSRSQPMVNILATERNWYILVIEANEVNCYILVFKDMYIYTLNQIVMNLLK